MRIVHTAGGWHRIYIYIYMYSLYLVPYTWLKIYTMVPGIFIYMYLVGGVVYFFLTVVNVFVHDASVAFIATGRLVVGFSARQFVTRCVYNIYTYIIIYTVDATVGKILLISLYLFMFLSFDRDLILSDV